MWRFARRVHNNSILKFIEDFYTTDVNVIVSDSVDSDRDRDKANEMLPRYGW